MTFDDILSHCDIAIGAGRMLGLSIPVRPRGQRVRLYGRRGPLSVAIWRRTQQGCLAVFEPLSVRRWLVEHRADLCESPIP